jgi:general L-amino acid transport system permease protein
VGPGSLDPPLHAVTCLRLMTESQAIQAPFEESRLALFRRWWGDHPIAQIIGLLGAAVVLGVALSNILGSMHRLGMSPTLDYLSQPANFDISESLIAYRAGEPYARAILVGILNTLKLAASGCAVATALGLFLGVARAAGNPLISKLVEAYVELIRNTPLVLQLFFWIALTRTLPPARQALEPLPATYLSIRGVYVPWFVIERGSVWPLAILFCLGVFIVHYVHKRLQRPLAAVEWLLIVSAGAALSAAWIWGSGVGVSLDAPVLKGFNIVGGLTLTPEFAAMLAGLSVYYAANVSEIVRAGLESVGRGQWEAGRALGFSRGRILQLIVLPQAMRVITPLITSTYLDLTKDTTLGVLIGFTEVTAVIKTSANNTGNAVETILVLLVVFLSISLPISAVINAYNRFLMRRGLVSA